MDPQHADLSGLSRAAAATTVPVPPLRWRTRIALPLVGLTLAAAIAARSAWSVLHPGTPVDVVPVVVRDGGAVESTTTIVVQAPGWVEADPFPVAVSALTDGVVAEVLVLEGERVEAGQVVARLVDDAERIALDQASAHLAHQRAALAVARATLDEARRHWDHPIELRHRQAAASARLAEKRAELARWPAELDREQARSAYLAAEYARLQPLHERGQANDIELVNAEQAHRAQLAEVERVRRTEAVLRAQIEQLEAGLQAATETLALRIEDVKRLAEAEALVRQAEAAVATAEAHRAAAALRLERTTVRSPGAGVVMVRLVEPGSKLMLSMDNPRSAQVVRLYDPQRLQVRVDVPLAEAARVGVGQRAEVVVDVLPDRVFDGVITRVVHEADVQKNTLQVKVAITDPVPAIKPEMLARARFFGRADAVATEGGARLVVTADALHTAADGATWVWLADTVAGVARRRPVTVAPVAAGDGARLITAGLQPGDRVIIGDTTALRDGQRIRLRQTEGR